ncbi:hypothetical protein Poly51_28690 [Rubripirellula tenax]|uniref:Uncharacterized protein n=1 Tax=Rubripirellula tenax TaxID=2528015 RepID=A0A5C6F8L5_9BACT|nr:hypothetical protein Poly51_28690 [Rubripirellula tenax]
MTLGWPRQTGKTQRCPHDVESISPCLVQSTRGISAKPFCLMLEQRPAQYETASNCKIFGMLKKLSLLLVFQCVNIPPIEQGTVQQNFFIA